MVSTAHSYSDSKEENQGRQQKKVQDFKFKDEDDLLIENFETGFDDELELILLLW